MTIRKKAGLVLISILLAAGGVAAESAQKILKLENYPEWKHIASPVMSSDGEWVGYALRPNGDDPTLYIRNLSSEAIHEIFFGSGPKFSRDARWAAYRVGVSKKEAQKLKKEKKPVPVHVELLNLASGEKRRIDNAAAFEFSRNSKYFIAKRIVPDKSSPHKGADLVFIHLDSGISRNIGNVGEHRFNKPGTMLAYAIDAADKLGNGLFLLIPADGRLIPLDTAEADYAGIAWDRRGIALAALRGIRKKENWERDNMVLAFPGCGRNDFTRFEYDPASAEDFPEGMVISERVLPQRRRTPGAEPVGPLTWSEDLSRLLCGIKPQESKPEKSEDPLPDVDVWHWKDEQIQSVQRKRVEYDLNFTYRAVIRLQQNRLIRLADEKMRVVTPARNGRWGLGRDQTPYLTDVETMQSDYYAVDAVSGKRKLIACGIRRPRGLSPDSRRFLFLQDKQFKAYDFESGAIIDISSAAPVLFVDEEDDHPNEKPPFGLAGWTKDSRGVIVNHRYDLWLLSLTGQPPVNITRGVGDGDRIRFRYVHLDPEEKFIDTARPLLLSAYGEWTKKSGFYSLQIGEPPRRLVYADKHFGRPFKAENADRLLYTMETFRDFPDYHVSGTDFSDPRKITDANPQQKQYAWGRRILIDYANSTGRPLQATLTLPAGYVEGKRYPMLVYFYEKMSQRHHQYSMPTYDDRPHMSAYASDGYLVLMPDVVFEIGKPGTSSLDCVGRAVEKVVELGYADPEHIGLQGHSWGGFQAAFIVTQTDRFACVVAGAPPSCIEGEFNQVFKSSGNNNHSYYSRSQGRMGTDPWKDHALYRSQSAIQNAAGITTPFLLLHGTADGSVDWMQSLEYYNAARYLGKNVIFLSYPGEPHHLAREENQKDFQTRMKQYFDHYLKGAAMPAWMKEGVPYLRKKRLFDARKEKAAARR